MTDAEAGLLDRIHAATPLLLRSLAAVLLLYSGSLARARPVVRAGNGLGVQIQAWRTDAADLERIRAAGFGAVRWGIARGAVEAVPGRRDWREADRLFAALEARGLASLVTIAPGDDRAAAPVTAEAQAGFARFAAAAAARYARHHPVWELLNEPDTARFWPPRPDMWATVRLLAKTCRAIKRADPAAIVVAPATAGMPHLIEAARPGLYAALAASPAATCLDALSVHAYRVTGGIYPDPESIIADHAADRRVLARLHPAWRKIPVIVSEWGYPTNSVTPAMQSAFMVRSWLANLIGGIGTSIVYEWRDSPGSPDNAEARFGLLDADNRPKHPLPAVLPQLAAARFVRRLPTPDPRLFALLFRSGSGFLVVCWLRTADIAERRTIRLGTRSLQIGYEPVLMAIPVPPRRIAADD